MTIEPVRFLPDIPADREALVLQRFALARRAQALIEHHDLLEANGCEVSFVRTEIRRAMAALRAVEDRLWQGGET
jgi:hypothetical protein